MERNREEERNSARGRAAEKLRNQATGYCSEYDERDSERKADGQKDRGEFQKFCKLQWSLSGGDCPVVTALSVSSKGLLDVVIGV